MPVDDFIYQGINRAVSDYTGARACEELINLRPTEGGFAPVKDFAPKFSNVDWDKVFVHYTTSGPKYIVVKRGSSAVEVYYLTNASDPTTLSSLFSVTGLSTDAKMNDVLEHLYFASAGNVVLFSVCAPDAGKYENHAFTWKMDDSTQPPVLRYVQMVADVPNVIFSISSTVETATTDIMKLGENSEKTEIIEAVQSGLNAVQEENPEICFGPVIIAIAFKTTDGSTFWTGNWRVHDPIALVKADDRFYLTASSPWDWNDYYVNSGFYTPYGGAYSMIPLINSGTQGGFEIGDLKSLTVPGTKVTISFPAITGWDERTSIIQSVEVYASKPALYLDADHAGDGFHYQIVSGTPISAPISTLLLPQRKYEDMQLGGQLLYHQASITMASLSEAAQTVNLSFGGNAQMTEETLDADAGALKRYGRLLSYNARFHYFDSVSKIQIGMPSFAWTGTGGSTTLNVFVQWSDDDQSELMYLGSMSGYKDNAYVVIAQSLNVKEVITVNPYDLTNYDVKTYRMDASSAYNFAINDKGPSVRRLSTSQYLDSIYYALIQGGVSAVLSNTETDAINVTEQYNPFVFRVEHSYKAPGNIIDVQPQMAGVADSSYGRDPLNVFTERGLYALTQGSANVLYGAFLPLSNLKASRGGIPVEAGTFFLADGALWLVSGRRVTLISEALSLGPHKYIRADAGYKKLCGTDGNFSPDPAPADPVYDVSPYLSQVEFKVFTEGGQLSYNRYRMELFISNPNYDYTYVLSLKDSQWHKLSRRLWQDDPGATIINQDGTLEGTITILDMSNEVSTSQATLLIHMQSRPFSMGYRYSHIHRIVAMTRAKLEDPANILVTALYGSDDLQHWTLLSYGKWAGKTEEDPTTHETTDNPLYISQMRIPSAARSWRYYTICIGGEITADPDWVTDFGPVLVDYDPVNRRIG